MTASGSAPTEHDTTDLERVLRENGLTDRPDLYDSSIHSWRCEHPDRYGPCSCFRELVGEIDALIAARVRTAQADAWDEGWEAARSESGLFCSRAGGCLPTGVNERERNNQTPYRVDRLHDTATNNRGNQ